MSGKINSFYDLEVWKQAHQLVLQVYKLTAFFPKTEEYRITSQLIRAVVSIPTNIAEGTGRYGTNDYIRFLIISRGSVEEAKYLVLLAKDLKYVSEEDFMMLTSNLNGIGKMLNSLIKSLKGAEEKKSPTPNP